MKKKTLLFLICMAFVGEIFSQLPEGMISLLPAGVKANVDTELKGVKRKNLVVAGDKSKGYKAFFAASNEANGEELWVTDGTIAGTKIVKDIYPGSSSSDVNYLTRFNDKVVFGANNGTSEMELWISDGTEEGTRMIKDIHDVGSSDPRGFTQLNETQFIFCAKTWESETYDQDRGAQWWLYVSDGTEDGTKMIKACDTKFPGTYATTWVTPYVRVARQVFFKADTKDGEVGIELWVTDGTEDGTKLVKDINTEAMTLGTGSASIDQMVNFYNEKLFFQAWTVEYGSEPWATDGTEEGTYLIKDTDPTVVDGKGVGGMVSCPGVYPYNGKVYYRGHSPEYGKELACTNLEPGDYTVFDINTNDPTATNSSTPDPGIEFDGVYMFCATTGGDAAKPTNFGGEQFYCDGDKVTMQWDIAPGNLSHWVKDPIVVSGSLYWYNAGAAVPEDKGKLFRIDSKTDRPQRITNFDAAGDKVQTLRNLNGDLLFFNNDENKGLYLYSYRKPGFDLVKDADDLDKSLEYRTRAEIAAASGIKEIKHSNDVAIYPNPVVDKFSFDVEGICLNIKIFDLTGRMLKTENNPVNNSVNVDFLARGIYKVIITTTGGTFVSSLIKK